MKSRLPRGALECLNTTPSPLLLHLQSVGRTKALKGFFTAKQYCFIMSVITIALAFGCYKNPYLSLFNLNCGFHLLMSSLAAIDLAKRRAALRGSKPRRSLSPLLALKWSKESLTSNESERWEEWMMSEMQNSFTFKHCLRRSEREAEGNLNERGSFSSWLWLGTSQRLGKGGGQRAWGSVHERGEKKADYRRRFRETEALDPNTCLDIVLTTMPVRQKQSWWNLWVVLLWISQQHSLCGGTVALAALYTTQ